MYVTNLRQTEKIRFRGSGSRFVSGTGTVPILIDYTTPTLVEGVYSWRTGKNAVSDPAVSPSVARRTKVDGFGIQTPKSSGSLVDRLADRKRYMEEFQKAAFPAETQTGSVSTNRTSTTDSGHLFCTHKTFRIPYQGHLTYYQDSSRNYTGDVWGHVGWGLVNPSPYPFYVRDTTSPLVVTETNRQGVANRYFASTAPDRNDATLMVTLLELLRGDIPSLLRNFQEMMAGMRSIKNLLGSDYLNIAFGWTPLIQEYANVIRVGMGLERMVYFESYRRKRSWDGPTARGTLNETISINMLNSAFNAGSLTSPGETTGPSSGWGRLYSQSGEWVASEDYHLTSKYTGLAKASRRANSFSDQAMDVVKQLGLVDDPRMLWDLTPYSWLVDWFTTMGDSISNANVYSPVRGKYNIDYAYFTTQHVHSAQGQLGRVQDGTGIDPRFVSYGITQGVATSTSVTRWRNRATPFGFGTQLGSLNATQYAILTALGLARTR